ncbi:MAG TPA: four helix bundle protein [Verrucomicrobiales bacterium]|nr:four helix bundle protein [Verrucomicrobiales bacterium]
MQDLKQHAKVSALDVIRFCRTVPRGDEFTIIKRQLIRSATSVAADYRSAQRAKSKADFISKLGTAEEEADESLLWLEFLAELTTSSNPQPSQLQTEANELVAILTASRKNGGG